MQISPLTLIEGLLLTLTLFFGAMLAYRDSTTLRLPNTLVYTFSALGIPLIFIATIIRQEKLGDNLLLPAMLTGALLIIGVCALLFIFANQIIGMGDIKVLPVLFLIFSYNFSVAYPADFSRSTVLGLIGLQFQILILMSGIISIFWLAQIALMKATKLAVEKREIPAGPAIIFSAWLSYIFHT